MDNSCLCGMSVNGGDSTEVRCNSSSSLKDQFSTDMISDSPSTELKINGGNLTKCSKDIPRSTRQVYYTEQCEEGEEEDEDDDEDEDEDSLSEDELLVQMGYGKSTPKREKFKEPEKQNREDDDEEEEEEDLLEESLLAQTGYLKKEPPKPLTTPKAVVNLVSALKGNRAQEGESAKERRVSWAPDVYDPPPSYEEHYAASEAESHEIDQKVKGISGRNRHKGGGKGSGTFELGGEGGKRGKGGGSKGTAGGAKAARKNKEKKHADKKQVKKRGGSANKYSNYVVD